MIDSELLHEWAARRNEAAFAELVRRYLGLVHASARRQVGASPLADDVAQAVFLVLARKAGSLGPKVVLSGWLFRTTRFVAARALRAELRRSMHETAAAMQTTAAAIPEHWRELEPHLDNALASLSVADRDALLLRYFEGRPLRDVGEKLGINEETAKKRVSRAVDKLREWFSGRGVALTAAGLSTVLANLPVDAAQSGLAARIVGAVTANTAGTSVVALAADAVRDWWFAQVRRLLPWAVTASLLCVTSGALLWRQIPLAPLVAPAETVPEPIAMSDAATQLAATFIPVQQVSSKILLTVRSSSDNRALIAQVGTQIWGKQARLGNHDSQTDTNGVIEIPVVEPGVNLVTVTVTVPGFVPKRMEWKRHEFVEPALFYQCLLDPGTLLEGVVQDEAGNPVADAKIIFSSSRSSYTTRECIAFDPRLTAVSSNVRGRFRGDQLPLLPDNGGSTQFDVIHPNYVRSRIMLSGPKSFATNHVVVLRPGEWIVGRVEDPSHAPVPDARIEEADTYAGRMANSGPDGVFKLGPFSKGPVKLEVSAKGYSEMKSTVQVGTDTDELVIQLPFADGSSAERQPYETHVVRLSGVVVDDESGEPVETFEIRRRQMVQGGEQRDLLGQGANGRFDWPVDMSPSNSLSLEAVADGYEDVTSGLREIGDGDQRFEFRMKRGGIIAGRVVDASGKPVGGATVGLNGDGFGFQLKINGTLSGWDSIQTVSDANGIFSLRTKLNAKSLVVAHEAGFVEVELPFTNKTSITLQPWGVIEGLVQMVGQPAPNQKVLLMVWPREPGTETMRTLVMQSVFTDSQGRFRYDHVPSTTVAVARDYTISTGESAIGIRQRVEVRPGATNEITLASSGRMVTGRFVLSQSIPGYDWRLDLQKLEQALPELQPISDAKSDREELRRRIRAHSLRRMTMSTFFPDIRPDGSFRIVDVPAGDYVLKVRISVSPNGEDSMQQLPEHRVELGSLRIPVTVTDGDFNDPPLDLGTISIPVKRP